MFFFWYCFDDWLATVTQTEWVGTVPWWVVLIAHFIIPVLWPRQNVTINRG